MKSENADYTREDFLKWYFDAALLVPNKKDWNEELWRKNPPRFYRFLRLDALGQALGIDCPLREFAEGKFIRKPLNTYQTALDKIANLCGPFTVTKGMLTPKPVTTHHEGWDALANVCRCSLRHGDMCDIHDMFKQLLEFRVALEDVIQFNRGVYEVFGGNQVAIWATKRTVGTLKASTPPLDEILCEFIAPHNPRLSEKFLAKEYGFPVVSVQKIDNDWV